jgi:5-bromo-4-chloroindolyl phosphate hydrolysis protein
MYADAVAAAPENTDQWRYYRGEAWFRLAEDQLEMGNREVDSIRENLERAKQEFLQITRPKQRIAEFTRVQEQLKSLEQFHVVVSQTPPPKPDAIVKDEKNEPL